MKKKAFAFFILFDALLTLGLSFVAGHNGDMPFYIASVLENEGTPPNAVFAKTREILKQELPETGFAEHAARLDKADPGIMGFYHIKPLYIWLVSLFHRLGFSYVLSTILPSLIAYFLIGVLVWNWAIRTLKPLYALSLSMLILLINPFMILARLSSPDALSCLCLLGVLYCIYFEKNSRISLSLLLLSIWIRMDNTVSALIIFSFMYLWPDSGSPNKIGGRNYFGLVILVGLMLLGMNAYFEADFWWFTKASYLGSVWQYGFQLLVYFQSLSQSFLMALILFFVLIRFRIPVSIREKTGFCLLMTACIFAARLILFPSFEERFAAAYYIFTIFLLAGLLNGLPVPGKEGKGEQENMFF